MRADRFNLMTLRDLEIPCKANHLLLMLPNTSNLVEPYNLQQTMPLEDVPLIFPRSNILTKRLLLPLPNLSNLVKMCKLQQIMLVEKSPVLLPEDVYID